MKKSIVIIIQSVLIVMFLAYALVQRQQALKATELAIDNERKVVEATAMAQQNAQEAIRQREIARHAEMLAATQAEASQKALAECSKKK